MTKHQLRARILKIWMYVRDNQNSLESQRVMNWIQETIEAAVQLESDRADREHEAAVEQRKDFKTEIKALKKTIEKLRVKIRELTDDGTGENDETGSVATEQVGDRTDTETSGVVPLRELLAD